MHEKFILNMCNTNSNNHSKIREKEKVYIMIKTIDELIKCIDEKDIAISKVFGDYYKILNETHDKIAFDQSINYIYGFLTSLQFTSFITYEELEKLVSCVSDIYRVRYSFIMGV